MAASPAMALTCDELRDQIEAKIEAAGVESFSVKVVDAESREPGKVVGTCELGAKKIVYSKTEPGARPPTAAAGHARAGSAPAAHPEPILTECKDGTVTMGGRCPR